MNTNKNIILIGGGIMSATLAVMLNQLMPDAHLQIFERLDKVGAESSAAWNNAGTGHAAYCELNYTPQLKDGDVDISKALRISESFEISKQFWSFLKEKQFINPRKSFINDIDHMSFVWGNANSDFLSKRYQKLSQYPLFNDMQFSTDPNELKEWIPLMMNGRDNSQNTAGTRMALGTDVNFGQLTYEMIKYLRDLDNVDVHLAHEIRDIKRQKDSTWKVKVKNLTTNKKRKVLADFVFIGAGGGTLPLLEKSDIPEARGYGGFPVGGQWLRCNNPEVIKQHEAKVYGMAEIGSPPMSVPHLDTRIINGERCLLFGPYAGFSTKFLKNGSYLDLFLSIELHNAWPMLSAGYRNIPLTKYLVGQVTQSLEDRFEMLQKYYPNAKSEDWELEIAGQRVQIIKKDKKKGGVLKFGTEVVTSADKSLAALLGASPGASTSVSIMLQVIETCFPEKIQSKDWQRKIKKMIPTYGLSLSDNGDLLKKTRERTTKILKLTEGPENW